MGWDCMNFIRLSKITIASFLMALMPVSVLANGPEVVTSTPSWSAGAGAARGVAQSASAVEGAANMGSLGNATAGGKYQSMCSSKNPWPCILAAMSFAQAGMSLFGAGKAGATSAAADFSNIEMPNFDNGSLVDQLKEKGVPNVNPGLTAAIDNGIKAMSAEGYKVDPETGKVTTPNGEYPAEAFSSGQSMASAGIIDESQIDDVNATIANVNRSVMRKMAKQRTRFGYGGAGGGARGAYKLPSYSTDGSVDYSKLFGRKRGPASAGLKTSGMVKLMNGQPIGVHAADIFEMIHNRYKKEESKNHFLNK